MIWQTGIKHKPNIEVRASLSWAIHNVLTWAPSQFYIPTQISVHRPQMYKSVISASFRVDFKFVSFWKFNQHHLWFPKNNVTKNQIIYYVYFMQLVPPVWDYQRNMNMNQSLNLFLWIQIEQLLEPRKFSNGKILNISNLLNSTNLKFSVQAATPSIFYTMLRPEYLWGFSRCRKQYFILYFVFTLVCLLRNMYGIFCQF